MLFQDKEHQDIDLDYPLLHLAHYTLQWTVVTFSLFGISHRLVSSLVLNINPFETSLHHWQSNSTKVSFCNSRYIWMQYLHDIQVSFRRAGIFPPTQECIQWYHYPSSQTWDMTGQTHMRWPFPSLKNLSNVGGLRWDSSQKHDPLSPSSLQAGHFWPPLGVQGTGPPKLIWPEGQNTSYHLVLTCMGFHHSQHYGRHTHR